MRDHYSKELAFKFVEKFARFECGLKEGDFCKRGGGGRAEPDWDRFKRDLGDRLSERLLP